MSMNTKKTILFLVSLVGIALLAFCLSIPAVGQSSGVIVNDADSTLNTSIIYSQDLMDIASSVGSRVVFQYANSNIHYDLFELPAALQALVDSLTPRNIVQYANSTEHLNLVEMPGVLQTLVGVVTSRNIVQYANSTRTMGLAYPLTLMNDSLSPEISQVSVGRVGTTTATTKWTTNEFGDSVVEYGEQSGEYSWMVQDSLFATEHAVVLDGLSPDTTYYFRVSSADQSGNLASSGEHSFTTGSLEQPDIGFRPNPHGYSFPNYTSYGPRILPPDYGVMDAVHMFGADAVCVIEWPICVPKYVVRKWLVYVNGTMSKGHCYGMAVTSLRFFKGIDNPADFQTGASTTYDLQQTNARQNIAYYHVGQCTDPAKSQIYQVQQNPPSVILNQLHSTMVNGAPDPVLLVMHQGDGGHAITPYSIEDRGNGVHWVWVYDNNYPDDDSRYVEISTSDDTWSYDVDNHSVWSGDANSDSLSIVSLSQNPEHPVCPWCNGGSSLDYLGDVPVGQAWLLGQGHLLITDSKGRRIGYVGDQFVNEIPGAYESIVLATPGSAMEPIYTVPLSGSNTILLDGQTLTQTERVSVTQFGPGYAVSAEDVTLENTSDGQLIIAPDGKQLAIHSGGAQDADLSLAWDSVVESYKFAISGADIGAGQAVTLTTHVDREELEFSNAQCDGGTYDLGIGRINAAGEQAFFHAGVVILATDTHYVDYGEWDGSGPMMLDVDHGSDGTIDETLELDNQASWQIYLPLVLRDH